MSKYWVGGTGNWSDTTHWSASSGGAGSDGVPGTTDDVIFDTASSTANAAYTVTVDTTANCRDFTMDGPDPADATKVTWAGSSALNIYGNLNLSGGTAGITNTYGATITLKATSGTKTITTNSVPFAASNFTFDGVGGTFQLVDTLILNSCTLIRTNGTVDFTTNSASVISNSSGNINGTFTFYDLTLNLPSANKTTNKSIFSNITVTNNFTVTGNSEINRLYIKSNTVGTTRTITCTGASVNYSNCDFQDITITNGTLGTNSSVGDCGGNTGITFTSPVTTTCSAGTTWSTATWSVRVPLPQDTANFSGSSRTITQDMPRIGSVDFTGSSGLTWTTSTTCSVFGSIDLTDLATLTASTQAYTFEGRGNNTLKSSSKTWGKNIIINAPGGTLSLGDNFSNPTSTASLTLTAGTFNANNKNLVISGFNGSNSNTRSLIMGSGIWEIGVTSSTNWDITTTTNLTLDAGTSTIKYTGVLATNRYFSAGGKTYNNFWNATTGAYAIIIEGSNTFNDFKIDAGRTVKFTNSTTQTVTTFTALGTSGSHITISNTSSTTHATLAKAGGGTITGCDYIDIQEITGSPDLTWYIGANSTDVGDTCTNIYLSDAPAPGGNTTNFFMFF